MAKTKLDHIYGASSTTVDLTPINNKITQLENKDNQLTTSITNLQNADQTLTTNITNVDTKVTNLSNVAVKNNIQNQVLPQQKINQAPTDPQHIIRNVDMEFQRIINHTSALPANTKHTWTVTLENNKIYEYAVAIPAGTYDACFGGLLSINVFNYYNNTPVMTFAGSENDLNESLKVKFWTNGNKIHMMCSQQVNGFRLMVRKNKGF